MLQSIPIIQGSIALSQKYSLNQELNSIFNVTLAPKKVDGSLYDLTDATTVDFIFDNGFTGAALAVNTITLPAGSLYMDTTGLLCTFGSDAADVTVTALHSLGGNLSAIASDGTHRLLVASGTWRFTPSA
jgi:hypothetical protein